MEPINTCFFFHSLYCNLLKQHRVHHTVHWAIYNQPVAPKNNISFKSFYRRGFTSNVTTSALISETFHHSTSVSQHTAQRRTQYTNENGSFIFFISIGWKHAKTSAICFRNLTSLSSPLALTLMTPVTGLMTNRKSLGNCGSWLIRR